MKKLLVFVLSLVGIWSTAQDVIIFKSGFKQNAKVLEVGNSNVVYKKNENMDGPNYVANVNEIAEIVYANGSRDILSQAPNNMVNSQPTPQNYPSYSVPGPAPVYVRPQVNVVVTPRPAFVPMAYNPGYWPHPHYGYGHRHHRGW